MQNIPKRSALFESFRRIFRAPPGYQIVAADYSAVELREIAEQSQDETMLAAFEAGEDPHAAMARQVAPDFDTLEKAERKRARNMAKACNFGLIYGSGPKGFATYARMAFGIDMTPEKAAEFIDIWRETYPGIVAWQENQRWQTKEDGYVATIGGRRWYWEWRAKEWDDPKLDDLEDWQVEDAVSGFSYTYACNHPIQGTCAEVMQVALAYLDKRLRPYDARLVATVHDEVVLVVKAADVRTVKRILNTTMTRAWLEFHPGSPRRGLVEIAAADTWADAH
jgi:DNA polymerase-1